MNTWVPLMNIIFVLIPIAILFVIIAGVVFFWAIRSEQFEDLDRQGSNILFDEDQPARKPAKPADHDSQP
jgi:cbb3-type cytochrome oxidase maturation protein